MYSVLGNHKTMTHQYTVNVIHVYRGLIVFTQHIHNINTTLYMYNKYKRRLDKRTQQYNYAQIDYSRVSTKKTLILIILIILVIIIVSIKLIICKCEYNMINELM